MPGADVVAVVAPPAPAGPPVRRTRPIEVVEVGVSGPVVVAEHRMADRLHAPPGSVVDRLEVRRRRAVVLDVAERKHRGKTGPDEKVRGGTLPAAVRCPAAAVVAGVARIAGDVAGRRDHGVGRGVCRPRADHGEHRHRGRRKSPRGQRSLGRRCSPSMTASSPRCRWRSSFNRKAGESGATSR